MAQPLPLAALKTHLKLSVADTTEDADLLGYLAAAVGAFEKESKRSFDATGDEALTEGERAMAVQWLKLMLGHWYENRQDGVVDVRVAAIQVPKACDWLMDLIRVPTL
jgi:hypothetical protein